MALVATASLVLGWAFGLVDCVREKRERMELEARVKELKPKLVIVMSGKRKSGKDYSAEKLVEALGASNVAVLHLSEPLKTQFAKERGLDAAELLTAGPYKEIYRAQMITWGEEHRNRDPGIFCRLASIGAAHAASGATPPIWIVVDARRPTDVEYFKTRFNTITVRVEASQSTRASRGWKYAPAVDDAVSECGLDGRTWDFVISNDGDSSSATSFDAVKSKALSVL